MADEEQIARAQDMITEGLGMLKDEGYDKQDCRGLVEDLYDLVFE